VTIPSASVVGIASIAAVSADTIVLSMADRRTVEVALDSVQSLDVSVGVRRGNFWAGAGLGLLGGAAIGALVGELNKPRCGGFMSMCELAAPIGGVIGGIVGLSIGGIVARIPRDVWRPVSLDAVRRLRRERGP